MWSLEQKNNLKCCCKAGDCL